MAGLPAAAIRPYRPGDPVAAHIAAIYGEFGLVYDPAFEDDLLDVGASYAHGRFLVVEGSGAPRRDGGPPGILATGAVVPSGGARLVKRMYVAAEGRRGGLARRLLRELVGHGDFVRTELWSDVRFPGAHALYRSEGFTPGPYRVLDDPDRSIERFFARR